MTEKKMPKISIGITSMTVILCVLCLTVFSVLSLSTALSERELSEKRAEATEAYYKAESYAAKMVNGLMLAEEPYVFKANNHIDLRIDENRQIFSFGWPIDDGQELSVELTYETAWEVTRWQVVSTAEWTPDESLSVWDGESMFEE